MTKLTATQKGFRTGLCVGLTVVALNLVQGDYTWVFWDFIRIAASVGLATFLGWAIGLAVQARSNRRLG